MKPAIRKPNETKPFWLDLLIVFGSVSVAALLGGVLTGSAGMISNVYFVAAVVLWIVAVVPIFGEVGGNAKLTVQARKQGIRPKDLIQAQEPQRQRAGRVTFLYGLSGILSFIFAFVALTF